MTQAEIIRMAKESGAVERYFGNQLHGIAFHKKEWLERFAATVAALVAANEREACLACYSPDDTATDWADKIRGRNEK